MSKCLYTTIPSKMMNKFPKSYMIKLQTTKCMNLKSQVFSLLGGDDRMLLTLLFSQESERGLWIILWVVRVFTCLQGLKIIMDYGSLSGIDADSLGFSRYCFLCWMQDKERPTTYLGVPLSGNPQDGFLLGSIDSYLLEFTFIYSGL